MKDVIDTLEKGVLHNIAFYFFFSGKDFTCQIGKYGLSGKPVEHFSRSGVLFQLFSQPWSGPFSRSLRASEWLCPHSPPARLCLGSSELPCHFRKSNELPLWVQILTAL